MGEPMDRSNRLLTGPPSTFEEALSVLEDATIQYYEVGKGTDYEIGAPWPKPIPFGSGRSLISIGGLMRCSTPHCNRGGFEIDREVFDMVRDGQVEGEFRSKCPGDEGSPQGRRKGRPCLNALTYRIKLVYKTEAG